MRERDDSGENSGEHVEAAFKFGSALIKPALNYILGSDDKNQSSYETTTPYNDGNEKLKKSSIF